MSDYRRFPAVGGVVFFTVVTHRRRPLLTSPAIRSALRGAVIDVRRIRPFEVLGWVLLPDHLHCIWRLPESDPDYSARWSMIKAAVTRASGLSAPATPSRAMRREGELWQRRFWEHTIRDEEDLQRHLDYVHWNPVKHRLVARVADWPYSTFHREVRLGRYEIDWGGAGVDEDGAAFGEAR